MERTGIKKGLSHPLPKSSKMIKNALNRKDKGPTSLKCRQTTHPQLIELQFLLVLYMFFRFFYFRKTENPDIPKPSQCFGKPHIHMPESISQPFPAIDFKSWIPILRKDELQVILEYRIRVGGTGRPPIFEVNTCAEFPGGWQSSIRCRLIFFGGFV